MAGKIKKISLVVFVLGFSAQALFSSYPGSQSDSARTLASLKKIDEFPLYELHYYGDYGFDDFLKQGIERNMPQSDKASPETIPDYQCTCFAALNEKGDRVFGRNFDWHRHPALILFTDSPNAYASVSMVDISYLGFSSEIGPNPNQKERLLEAPFYPFDGMNECGLAVGMNALSYSDGGNDSKKTTIGSLHFIRLLLDHAKNVDEALSLLRGYNVLFREVPIHYLVADASGHSAIIEFIGGEVRIVRNSSPFQVTTNFVITDTPPDLLLSSCRRYSKVFKRLEAVDGIMAKKEALSLLEGVSQPGETSTIWSIVYNLSSGSIQLVMDRKFDRVYAFDLKLR